MKIIYKICIYLGLSTPRQLKKIILKTFFRTWWVHQVLSRKGECKRCGKCCPGCTWLVEEESGRFACKDYVNKPCMASPITQKERNKINPNCGYYWRKEK